MLFEYFDYMISEYNNKKCSFISKSAIMFSEGGIEYVAISEGNVLIYQIAGQKDHLIIPSEVLAPNGGNYKIIGFAKKQGGVFYSDNTVRFNEVSFDDSSEIEVLPISLFLSCQSVFHLPPKFKHFRIDMAANYPVLSIKSSKNNKYVTIIDERSITTHHPYMLLNQELKKSCPFLKETLKVIGTAAYYRNQKIKKVIFPPSVELIDYSAFYQCENLRSVTFRGISKLKIIYNSAFYMTPIKEVRFPASVEEICYTAFYHCKHLTLISFQEKSKLRKIGRSAFYYCNIKYVDFPANLEEIEDGAFDRNNNLSFISFPADSKLKSIGNSCFSDTNIKSVDFPASLEVIGKYSFNCCHELAAISFKENSQLSRIKKYAFHWTDINSVNLGVNSNLVKIGTGSFLKTKIESIDIPSSVEEIGNEAFRRCPMLKSVNIREDSKLIHVGENVFDDNNLTISWCRILVKNKISRCECY